MITGYKTMAGGKYIHIVIRMSLSLLYVLDNFSQILVWFMVFIATFNNILAISWRSVLLVEVIAVHGEDH